MRVMHLWALLSFKMSDGRHECVCARVLTGGVAVREAVPCLGGYLLWRGASGVEYAFARDSLTLHRPVLIGEAVYMHNNVRWEAAATAR